MLLIQIEHLISCFSCCGVCCILACNNIDTLAHLWSNGASRICNLSFLNVPPEYRLHKENESAEDDHRLDVMDVPD